MPDDQDPPSTSLKRLDLGHETNRDDGLVPASDPSSDFVHTTPSMNNNSTSDTDELVQEHSTLKEEEHDDDSGGKSGTPDTKRSNNSDALSATENNGDDDSTVNSDAGTSMSVSPDSDQASELLISAAKMKEEGNAFFKAGDFDQAARSYRRGCNCLKKILNFSGDEQVTSLWIVLQTNLSMVLSKQGKHVQSVSVASKVIERDSSHVKALYRRAVAYRQLGEWEKARDDLRTAIKAEPENAVCKKELSIIKKELDQIKENQKRALSRAFSSKSSLLYEDKEIDERRREEKKKREKEAQQELQKKRKQEWEDECVKRMARNEAAITFEDWEAEQKKTDEKKKKDEEKARKAKEKQRREALRQRQKVSTEKEMENDSDDEVFTEKELEMMRGYKKTRDGRTTSYFTREIPEEEKIAYDVAPKRLDEVSNSDPALFNRDSSLSDSKVASAWNLAGTWEEKDTTAWCTDSLRKRLEEITVNSLSDSDLDVNVLNVEKLDGHASVAVTGNKKRYIFEYEASLNYEIKSVVDSVVASGTVHLIDICSTHLDDFEVSFSSWKTCPDSALENKAKEAQSSFVDQIRHQVLQWVEDFNEQY